MVFITVDIALGKALQEAATLGRRAARLANPEGVASATRMRTEGQRT